LTPRQALGHVRFLAEKHILARHWAANVLFSQVSIMPVGKIRVLGVRAHPPSVIAKPPLAAGPPARKKTSGQEK
jgi:hypothetical protein